MPVVPTVTGRQVESRGVNAPAIASFNTPNIGDALADAGQKAVGVLAEAKNRANVAMAQDAALQLSQADESFKNELFSLQGKNAIGQGQHYAQQYDAKIEELAGSLPDDASRQMFMRQAQQQRVQFQSTVGRYELGQVRQYEEGQFQATLTANAKTASDLYGDNAAYVATNKQTFDQIEQYGSAHGWSPEQIQAKKVEFKEKVADSALSQWSSNNAIAFIQSNGELSDTAAGSRRAPSGGSAGVRGIRNNNPGNLEFSDSNPWVGQAGSDGRFAKFETPEHGIRALGRNLLSYQKQGIDTVNDIINRWAPPEDKNDTAAYIRAVCAQLGVEPGQQINASDPDTLKALCAAIIHHENGDQPYNAQQLSTGVNAALGISDLPTAGKRYTGNAAFDAASPQAQAAFLRQSEQMRNQQQAEYRAMLDGQVRDATAAYMRGVEFPDAPSQMNFVSAYGVREGNARYTEFRNNQIAGQYIGAFRTLPTQSIEAAVKSLEPGTDDTGEGYAARAQTYDAITRAASEVIRQRQADPVQFSLAAGQTKPVMLNSQDGFAESIALRASQVEGLSQSYGTPLTFFSKEEASQIGTFFRDAPVSQQSAYLDAIHKSTGGGKNYMAALQQISVNAPSAAVAGILMDKPGGMVAEKNWFNPDVNVSPATASQTILAGAAARKGTKEVKGMVMPKENDMRLEFTDKVQDAFAGDAQGATMAYEVAKDYYAGVMSQKGDFSGELDNNVWNQAINVATGGTYDYNGMGNVLLPWGMAPEQFDKQVNQAWEIQVVSAGIKAPPGQYGLQSYGDSQYLVKLGTGYLLKDDGTPVIIDLTQQRQRFSGEIPQ